MSGFFFLLCIFQIFFLNKKTHITLGILPLCQYLCVNKKKKTVKNFKLSLKLSVIEYNWKNLQKIEIRPKLVIFINTVVWRLIYTYFLGARKSTLPLRILAALPEDPHSLWFPAISAGSQLPVTSSRCLFLVAMGTHMHTYAYDFL